MAKRKAATPAERKHMDAVAAMGCVICLMPACVHHVRRHGEKKDNMKCIPLCPKHHQHGAVGVAIHEGRESWEANHGSELGWLDRINKLLGV